MYLPPDYPEMYLCLNFIYDVITGYSLLFIRIYFKFKTVTCFRLSVAGCMSSGIKFKSISTKASFHRGRGKRRVVIKTACQKELSLLLTCSFNNYSAFSASSVKRRVVIKTACQ